MSIKTWNVRVHKESGSVDLGQVHEDSEELARCAALSKFHERESDPTGERSISLEDDFDVSPA